MIIRTPQYLSYSNLKRGESKNGKQIEETISGLDGSGTDNS
jgi:hypothetical protein